MASGTLKYGRWDNTVCPGPGVTNSTAPSFQIFNFPMSCLQGINSCYLGNLIQNFGDPIPTVAKHVRVIIYVVCVYVLNFRPSLLVGDKLDLQ